MTNEQPAIPPLPPATGSAVTDAVKLEHELLDWAETLLCAAECPQHCSPEKWRGILKRWRDEKHSIHKSMRIPDMTISTHKFWEVAWRYNGRLDGTYHPDNPVGVKDSRWYVSDPFADKDSAQKYADFRAGQDCDSEVWEVVKMKSKVGVGRELGDQGGN